MWLDKEKDSDRLTIQYKDRWDGPPSVEAREVLAGGCICACLVLYR